MPGRRSRWLAPLLMIACLGCAARGPIGARLVPPNEASVPIAMSYETRPVGNGGTLFATMPGGEEFSGRYLQITATVSADSVATGFGGWGPWAPYWGDWGQFGPGPWYGGGGFSTFAHNYSGVLVATLFGDRGDVMRCRFHLASPAQGITGGGVGECEVSGGARIDAQF